MLSTFFPPVINRVSHNILCLVLHSADTYGTPPAVRIQSNKMCFYTSENTELFSANDIGTPKYCMMRVPTGRQRWRRENAVPGATPPVAQWAEGATSLDAPWRTDSTEMVTSLRLRLGLPLQRPGRPCRPVWLLLRLAGTERPLHAACRRRPPWCRRSNRGSPPWEPAGGCRAP